MPSGNELCPSFNPLTLVITYLPSCNSLVTSKVNVPISLLYPVGACVSSIVILSVPSSETFISFIVISPSSPVTRSLWLPSGNVILKSKLVIKMY